MSVLEKNVAKELPQPNNRGNNPQRSTGFSLWKIMLLFFVLISLASFGIYSLWSYKNSLDDQRLREGLQTRNFLVIKEIESIIKSSPVGSFDHDKWKNLLCKAIPSHPYCGGDESSYGKDVEKFLLESSWASVEGLLGSCLTAKEKSLFASAIGHSGYSAKDVTVHRILEEFWNRYRYQFRRGGPTIGGKRGAMKFFMTLRAFFPNYFSSFEHSTLDGSYTWEKIAEHALVKSNEKDWISARRSSTPWSCWLEFVNSIRPEPLRVDLKKTTSTFRYWLFFHFCLVFLFTFD